MESQRIRQTFIDFFERHGHQHVPSSSLVPEADPTLLFANAGMNQFKRLFLGQEQRPYRRAVTAQKVVRAGGKHNDLENVGFTARHHTFFEMLGNFSFGDYFKKDAIHFAWELLTKDFGIDKNRLSVTVFETDDEAAEIWHKQEGVPRERIHRFGEKDNFWRMGDTGPCGPCSEIYYDHGPGADAGAAQPSVLGGDGDRYVEIWNLVFMQYNEDGTTRVPLPKPSVDTGAGLERWSAMLQGVYNNFDTDVFQKIIQSATRVSGCDYQSDLNLLKSHPKIFEATTALRVIADHSRAAAFLIADGVLPSNEGRGYVLRRIMRRAIRYGRKLSVDPSLYVQTVAATIDSMGGFYSELGRAREHILQTVKDEIERFLATLDQGTEILLDAFKKLDGRGGKVVDGALVFQLYDTFGFPVDLTQLVAQEHGYTLDHSGFEKKMEEAKQTARAASSAKFKASASAEHFVQMAEGVRRAGVIPEFVGYQNGEADSQVVGLSNGRSVVDHLSAGAEGYLIASRTPFYAESGGQVGDKGVFSSPDGAVSGEIFDCMKQDEYHLHHIRVTHGALTVGLQLKLSVTTDERKRTERHHSATHLLHAALREVLGTHVTQAGSLVDAQRLRFDFTHSKPLTRAELQSVEAWVNARIEEGLLVDVSEKTYNEAISSGAMALFGEKYGDRVRVIQMASSSTELCGGTHVSNTADIRAFRILSESGVSAGVRRIEAVAGSVALKFLTALADEALQARELLHLPVSFREVSSSAAASGMAIAELQDRVKHLEREVKQSKASAVSIEEMLTRATPLGPGRLVVEKLDIDDREVLSDVLDRVRSRSTHTVVVLFGASDAEKTPAMVGVSDDWISVLQAGKILQALTAKLGGKGGGRPQFAQGAVERAELPVVREELARLLGGKA